MSICKSAAILWGQLTLGVVFLVNCTAAPQQLTVTDTAWEPVIDLATVEQLSSPALAATTERVTLAWIGTDSANISHSVVAIASNLQTPTVPLPLDTTFPRDSQLFPAAGKVNHHLLWLDTDALGQSQLFTAVVDETLGIFRGPLPVSTDGATCYAGFERDDGSVWVVWYAGGEANAALHSATIEPTGLVLRQQVMWAGGGCPTAARTFEQAFVLWNEGRDVFAARFVNGFIDEPLRVGQVPALANGDRLRAMQEGSDGERLYVFYNVTRADGTDETWFASGLPDDLTTWVAPRLLTALPDETRRFETGFNTGKVLAAEEGFGGGRAAWAAPVSGVAPVLSVVAEVDSSTLSMIYLQGGTVVGYQPVASISPLLGSPQLHTDRERHLYLSWSEPQATGAATLRFASTKNLLD